MKKLSNAITTLSRNKKLSVKIGSKGGSGLWYCSKLTTHSLAEIQKENELMKRKEKRQLEYAKWKLNNLDEYYNGVIDRWLKLPKHKYKTELEKKMFIANQERIKQGDKVRLPVVIKHLEYDLSIDFLNRSVVEIVNGISPDEPNTKVIYVKGYERGDYWTIKEYIKGHLPKDKQRTFDTRLRFESGEIKWLLQKWNTKVSGEM